MPTKVAPLFGVFDEDSNQLVGLSQTPAADLPLAGATPDAAATVKGKVKLAGALGGTADVPTALGYADQAALITAVTAIAAAAAAAVVNGAPGVLDTLKELADALGDDPNYAVTLAAQLATKASTDSVMTLVQTPNQVLITATGVQELTLSTPQDIATTSSPTFRDLTVRKLQGSGVPTLSAWGTGAGSNSTPTAGAISGTDLFVKVSVTPSASPAANQTIANIAWSGGNGEFAAAPDVVVVALNHAAQGVLGSALAGPIATATVNGVTLTSGVTTALTAGTAYIFGLLVLGK